jgi:hypothetical protein
LTRHQISFEYPFPPNEVVTFFRQYYNTIGPTQTAFKRLVPDGQAALASALESLGKSTTGLAMTGRALRFWVFGQIPA